MRKSKTREQTLTMLFERRVIQPNGCWFYNGAHRGSSSSYPSIRWQGKYQKVSRLILHLLKDFNLDSNLNVNHSLECNDSRCWNPDHLYVGTQHDNVHDTKVLGTHRGWALNNYR